MIMIMMTIMIIIVSTPALQVSLDPEHDNTNLKIGPKNTMEIAILNDDDPGKKKDKDKNNMEIIILNDDDPDKDNFKTNFQNTHLKKTVKK